MNDVEDRAKAYSFDLHGSQSTGTLRVGWRNLKVSVIEYSWEGYTILASPATARHLRTGRQGVLEFQGSNYQVSCLDSKSLDDGSVEVHLELDQSESKQQASKKKKRTRAQASISLNHKDPVLGTATWIGLLLLLMILPGWGEGWGTTTFLSDGFRSIFVSVCDVCNCVVGR